jgi:hypothetical protein
MSGEPADRPPTLAQARVAALLSREAAGTFATSTAERSPVGPRALRVRRGDDCGPEADARLARWLDAQPWVAAVAPRPPHVYVRVTTEALRSWVVAGFDAGTPARGTEGEGRRAVVRLPGARRAARPLDEFREMVVVRAVVALLAGRGFDARLAPGPPGPGPAAVTVIKEGAAGPGVEEAVSLPVGGVDVPHGPMRARYGGQVGLADLISEARARAAGPAESDRYAEALLGFALLRTERSRRVRLDEPRLRGAGDTFDAVLAVLAPPGPADGARVAERPVRELASELDLLPVVAARAAGELEPAHVARYLRDLATRVAAARPWLPPGDPLWRATSDAIGVAFNLTGLDRSALTGPT